MRQRFVLGTVFAAALAACGGSSSETPPPLQPDPIGFHYAPALPKRASDSDAGSSTPLNHAASEDPKPVRPPRSTWGGSAAKH